MIRLLNSKDLDIDKVKDFYCNYVTWKVLSKYEDWEKIIKKSSSIITCWDDNSLIGMARSLSEEVRWATIIDALVHPDHRGKGIGSKIIESLLEQPEMQVRTIYLATPDKADFYSKLGFKIANDHCYYMIKVQKGIVDNYVLPIN
ncbi:hypothetical protein AVM15_07845 [Paraclostridium benzoelyticum]|nr:hypothetical protein AVM15_07845 [Paraclostridium benzoelyticum]